MWGQKHNSVYTQDQAGLTGKKIASKKMEAKYQFKMPF